MSRLLKSLSVSAALLLAAASAEAAMPTFEPEKPKALTDDELAEVVDFVVGNAVFALYHQAGHMMAERYGLKPKDETGADRFAVMTLLDPRSGAGDQTLVDAIDSFRLAGAQGDIGDEQKPPDAHAIDAQRAAAIACDMVGADRAGFSDIGDAMGLPSAVRGNCERDWRKSAAELTSQLEGIRRKAGDLGKSLPIAYDPPLESDVAEATILEDNHVLEEVAAKLGTTYAFAAPPTVRAAHCDAPTSRYDSERNELVLCYELSAEHGQLILRDIQSRG